MIFARIYDTLYRVIRVDTSHSVHNPCFTLLDECGAIHKECPVGWPSGSWRIYTRSVAAVLTLIARPGYSKPRMPVYAIWSDKVLARAIPASLVGDKR